MSKLLPIDLAGLREIPAEIITSVIESVEVTFESISGSRPEYSENGSADGPMNGIIGHITVFNSNHTLTLMVAIPRETALSISEVFCGMEIPFDSDDMGDLVGEVSNILAGEVAANVEQVGFTGQSSLPTVTRGSDLKLFMPNKPPTARLRFEGSGGGFWVNLALCESRRRK
jgi:chemotaxis protein CheX